MSSVELENKKIIHDNILPRLELLEQEQKAIKIEMGILTNQMKALELSNNDIKQTVTGYGQTHSRLLISAMDSLVQINAQNTQIVREVQTTKDKVMGGIQKSRDQSNSEVKVASLGMKEKVIVAGLAAAGASIPQIPKAFTFIIDLFK